MNDKLLNVLVIEDDDDDFKLLVRELRKENIPADSLRVDTVESLQNAFLEKEWDIVISDNNIPDRRISIESSFKLTRKINPDTPFIILSGTIGEENAIQLMKLGIQDYILKDNLRRLGPAIKREMADAATRIKKREAEKQLLESQERYRILATSITDMFFALDKNLICTFWNSAAEKITGVGTNDAVGKYIFDILPLSHDESLREKMKKSFTSDISNTIEIEYKRENRNRHFQVTVYPSNEIHSVIIKDITESKNITRKLRAVNDELETFIYRLSHDLRGPVASVQGLINLARNEKLALLESDFFSRINIMAGRMDDVISSFQDVVRIKQEKPVLQETTIQEVMAKAMEKLDCSGCDFQLKTKNSSDNGILVTDPEFLVIAIENILINAMSYRHEERKPSLTVEFVTKKKEYFQIVISDNGVGIPPELIDKIFNMFFRGNTKSSGPGLGLYLAQNAVEKLGGTIRVNSTLNQGSSFSIRLPFDPTQKNQPPDQFQMDAWIG